MPCTCGSTRIASVSGKCSDLCSFETADYEHEGYVPEGVGIGGGDCIEFDYCLDCGLIQGQFPIKEDSILEWAENDEEDEPRHPKDYFGADTYLSADGVRDAYRAGKLTLEQAKTILRVEWGMK